LLQDKAPYVAKANKLKLEYNKAIAAYNKGEVEIIQIPLGLYSCSCFSLFSTNQSCLWLGQSTAAKKAPAKEEEEEEEEESDKSKSEVNDEDDEEGSEEVYICLPLMLPSKFLNCFPSFCSSKTLQHILDISRSYRYHCI